MRGALLVILSLLSTSAYAAGTIDCGYATVKSVYVQAERGDGSFHANKVLIYMGADKSAAAKSFTAIANYDECVGKDSLRVVSCNTTSLVRTLHTVNREIGIKEALAVLVRRAADPPDDVEKGPINSIAPVTKIPSHHGPDVQTVLPGMNITTMACMVPVTLSHVHFVTATLNKEVSRGEVLNLFRKASRILLFDSAEGYKSSSQIAEMFRDIVRPRNDMYEVGMWEDSINVVGNRIYWSHAVHSEAIVVPETVDAIRAVMKAGSKADSMKKTNKSLCIEK